MRTSPLPTLPLHPLAPQLCQILNNSPPPLHISFTLLHGNLVQLHWKLNPALPPTPRAEPKGGVGVPVAPAAARRQLSVSSAQNPHLSGSPRPPTTPPTVLHPTTITHSPSSQLLFIFFIHARRQNLAPSLAPFCSAPQLPLGERTFLKCVEGTLPSHCPTHPFQRAPLHPLHPPVSFIMPFPSHCQ